MDKILFVILAMLGCMTALTQGQTCNSGEESVTLEMFDVKQKNTRKFVFRLMDRGQFRPARIVVTNITNIDSMNVIVIHNGEKETQTFAVDGRSMSFMLSNTGEHVDKILLVATRGCDRGTPSYDVTSLAACVNVAGEDTEGGQTEVGVDALDPIDDDTEDCETYRNVGTT